MRLSGQQFERLVSRAVKRLPPSVRRAMDNVDIVVEQRPRREHLAAARVSRDETLLGLYQGVPLTSRGSAYSMVLPDKITIFQRPIEAACETPEEIEERVRQVVLHELAHHFGMDEAALEERGVG